MVSFFFGKTLISLVAIGERLIEAELCHDHEFSYFASLGTILED